MNNLKSKSTTKSFEIAKDAVLTLSTIKTELSAADEETLSILIDEELLGNLQNSLNEAKKGQLEPLTNVL